MIKQRKCKKTTELKSQVNSLNGTVSDLQGKINKVTETVIQNTKSETTNNNVKEQKNDSKVSNNENVTKTMISGKFAQNSPEDKGEYWFKNDGTVENDSSATTSGVYTIK